MVTQRISCSFLAVAFVFATIGCKDAKSIDLGASPSFSDIAGIDGKTHSLADYKDSKAVIVVFTCNRCPVAKAYEDRLVALQKDYTDKSVQIVAINVNKDDANRLDAMKEAKEKAFNFPYLFDESQKSGRDFGAKCTPHVFLLNGDRKVAYIGAIDDSIDSDKVETKYLRNALDEVLAGKTPTKAQSAPTGCGIHYE